jgi:hypothetical protein
LLAWIRLRLIIVQVVHQPVSVISGFYRWSRLLF